MSVTVPPRGARTCLLLTVVLGACEPSVHDPEEVRSGAELFAFYCVACHGENGGGNFALGTPENRGTTLSALQISHWVRVGSSDSDMPAFEHLTDDETQRIAEYLLQL